MILRGLLYIKNIKMIKCNVRWFILRFSGFAEMLGFYAGRTPDAPALLCAANGALRTLTYRELENAVTVRAQELRACAKTCMGVFADGTLPCVVEIFAAVRAGMQVVLLDASVPTALLRGILPYTDVDLLWGDAQLCAELAPNLSRGVKNGAGRMLFFTSGTTERSKAVMLTERSLCASAYNGSALLPLAPEDRLLCMLPLGHVFGFVCGLLWGLTNGACVALGRGAQYYADDCSFFRPTAITLVPMLMDFLLKQNLLNEELGLILVGAGDCPSTLMRRAKARGVRVSYGYGLTETSSGVALSLGEDPFAMSICPDDNVTIASDGEILVKTHTCMMEGYYKCPEDTSAVLSGGVLHTGDLGEFDARGYLRITGRKKDMLVFSDGTKLFLPEAEAELAELLGGGDLALALRRGGRVTLAIYGDERSDEELFEAMEPYQMSHPHCQQVMEIARQREPLPRTATGKVKRWELNARL